MVRCLLFCLLAFNSLNLFSQKWRLDSTINIKEKITAISVDPDGVIYIGSSRGNIFKFDQKGKEAPLFSTLANAPITSLEAWNRLRIFAFQRNTQEFLFLNRFNASPSQYSISKYQSHLATLSCPGIDNSIWILASEYNEIRKYDLQTSNLILTNPLQIDLSNANYMRAYQNLLIISDSNSGLFFFDQYGLLRSHLKETGISYFQIIDHQIIALRNNEILQFDLDTQILLKKIKAPPGSFYQVVKSNDKFLFVSDSGFSIYSLEL